MDNRLADRKFSRVLNKKYERLTVIDDLVYWEKGKTRKVLCRCDCGSELLVGIAQLNSGNTKSCGCLQREVTVKRNYKHGFSKRSGCHDVYTLWGNIINRCSNINNDSYKDYGARGINICDEWRNDFQKFIGWCLDNGWEKGLTIDRIDNNGDYEPFNCRFVTRQENNSNRRLLKSDNKSGYRGVYKRKYGYTARVFYKNKTRLDKFGFDTAKEAAIYRDEYCIKNNIPFALNFPELKEVKI